MADEQPREVQALVIDNGSGKNGSLNLTQSRSNQIKLLLFVCDIIIIIIM
jgi:hypothetical protein